MPRAGGVVLGRFGWPLGLALVVGFGTAACKAEQSGADGQYLTSADQDGTRLELTDRDGRCVLRIDGTGQRHELDIPAPCGFVRAGARPQAQSYSYEGVGRVFVVAGPAVDADAYPENVGVQTKHQCSNHGQAVILHEDRLTLRSGENIPVGFCHKLGFGEKQYYAYAHPLPEDCD